ncbi:putative late blight resistance protein homolog R1A-3 isoform X2 [Andrographis paniculata]|uniref:putative late blight resistance protein homolog R1A-3 isoform X2 n=1 Tax=Andrographis paniculata TaxID=175694 RepID=UPI0021E8C056|nr:putative late blight resistance protein homolog R1A-3 isoform X2 [Andrographis paniculata]
MMKNTQILQTLLQEIIEWIKKSYVVCDKNNKRDSKNHVYRMNIPCSLSDLRIFRNYVASLGADSDLSSNNHLKMWNSVLWEGRFSHNKYKLVAEMVKSFLNDLNEVFKVPKLQKEEEEEEGINALKKIRLVAGFVEVLGQFLKNNKDLSVSGINDVLKELRCFITIFQDTPFQASEDEQVQCLLEQFEGVVNDAGRFVHSVLFSYDRSCKKVDESFSETITLLKCNVTEFLKTLPNLITSKVVYRDVDSYFIVDSLLNEIETIRCDVRLVEVKDQIEMLDRGIMMFWPMIEKNLDTQEFRDVAGQVRNIAYGVEHLIDSFLVGEAPLWYLTVSLKNVIHNVERIQARVREMLKNYESRALIVSKDYCARQPLQWRMGAEDGDIGNGFFEEEEMSILEKLMGGTESLQIISIVGTPGLGKSTLAKKLHDHPSVVERFDRRSFSIVSQNYHRKNLLSDILSNLEEGAETEGLDEDGVAIKIRQILLGRRCLVTLDDIWSYNTWDDLRICFADVANGSRILFTSRNKDVAPPGSVVNKLPFWSNDQCWRLLERKIFGRGTCHEELKRIGQEIAAKCKGLPLVATVIGGVLSSMDKEVLTWENVARNLDSYLSLDQNKSIMQILELSYTHLPHHLKPCFLYFGVFQEDTEISVTKLIQLWIAEGFVNKSKKKEAESLGEEYLIDLINKSLVIVVKRRSNGGAKTCVVHDLLHDMCLRIGEAENFLKREIRDQWRFDPKYCAGIESFFLSNRLVLQSSCKCLQPYGPWIRSFFLSASPSEHLSVDNLKLLRVLDCLAQYWSSSYNVIGIERLVNLRYLSLRQAPKCILNLTNLEYLIVAREIRLSPAILKMPKLRYLRAYNVIPDNSCRNISETNNLEFLSLFYIEKQNYDEILKYSPHLRRLKCNFFSSSRKGKAIIPRCFDLSFLRALESLSVSSSGRCRMIEIRFPDTLRKVSLNGFCFPWRKMSMLGALPNLEVLKLRRDAFVGKRWETREFEFQKLRWLELWHLDVEQWEVSCGDHFPKLEQLVVRFCNFLVRIPREIGHIGSLQSIKVWCCGESIKESVREIVQEQEDWGNDDLRVILDRF